MKIVVILVLFGLAITANVVAARSGSFLLGMASFCVFLGTLGYLAWILTMRGSVALLLFVLAGLAFATGGWADNVYVLGSSFYLFLIAVGYLIWYLVSRI